jgi:hypothetical protein
LVPVSDELLLSVALIVKFDVPVVVGVPLSTPVLEFRLSHDGKLPALTAKVYVPEPPVALSVALYELLAVAFVNDDGLTVKLEAASTVSV